MGKSRKHTMSGLVAENQALIAKLGELVTDKDELEEELMQINYTLKKKIAAQQTAQGEVPDSLGLSPKERKALKKVFAKFDKNSNGTIEAGELQAVAEELGEPLTEEEIAEGMSAMGGIHRFRCLREVDWRAARHGGAQGYQGTHADDEDARQTSPEAGRGGHY